MGHGDELMVAGEARRRATATVRKFAVRAADGGQRWQPVWEGNPRFARPGEACDAWIDDWPGNRPYIAGKSSRQWTWRPYAPMPAELFFTDQERILTDMGAGRVLLEPHLKPRASLNKDWGWVHWQKLVARSPDLQFVQVGPPGTRTLDGVQLVPTGSFREACAVLAGCIAAVLPEGGLHHAAAAVETPAVVIRGGYIGPEVTGYAGQRSLFVASAKWPLGCGYRIRCRHCDHAMAAITPERAAQELEVVLGNARRSLAA